MLQLRKSLGGSSHDLLDRCRLLVAIPVSVILSFAFGNSTRLQEQPRSLTKQLDTCRKALKSGSFLEKSKAIAELDAMGPEAKKAIPELFDVLLGQAEYDPDVGMVRRPPLRESSSALIIKLGSPELIAECLSRYRMGTDEQRRDYLTEIIKGLYRPGDVVADRLICEGLQDPSELLRVSLATIFFNRPSTDSAKLPIDAVPHLMKMLRDGSFSERGVACVSLRSFGPRASNAIPLLDKKVRFDDEVAVQTRALEAIGAIGCDSEQICIYLRGLLKHKDGWIRCAACDGLRISKFGKSALPDLLTLLKTTDADARTTFQIHNSALWAINDIGPSKQAVPFFAAILEGPDPDEGAEHLQYHLMSAISKLGSDGAQLVPLLVANLDDPTKRTNGYDKALYGILKEKAVPLLRDRAEKAETISLRNRSLQLLRSVEHRVRESKKGSSE